MRRYLLDSSVAVRILLGHSPAAATWFADAAADPDVELLASRLLRTEVTRVLRREGLPVSRRDEVVDYVGTIPISDAILAEAEAIVPHVKTLDAIHLASLLHTGLDATIVTHDANMRAVAEVLGYPTVDPVAD
ncbi:MAG TPA: PIN domain-containing protein [Arachnia sp.]|nr:PIN domain-containing protein [Propionibacteriaceae bacterium]HOA28149.1 PIN domain-containing protein [Arachnia sp.]HQD21414.1 PIN domain-containing protein [Arachnia sp.]